LTWINACGEARRSLAAATYCTVLDGVLVMRCQLRLAEHGFRNDIAGVSVEDSPEEDGTVDKFVGDGIMAF
jgi:class 3 adenylate cyclase